MTVSIERDLAVATEFLFPYFLLPSNEKLERPFGQSQQPNYKAKVINRLNGSST